MNLAELLDGIVKIPDKTEGAIEVEGITLDSRKVEAGYVFLAVSGLAEHGLNHVKNAIEKGATIVIYDQQGSEEFSLNEQGVSYISAQELGFKAGYIADRFYHSPSTKMDVIGITGTNGKTTCSQFLVQLISHSGVIGTLGWGEQRYLQNTLNTTPDALVIQQILADFVRLKKQTVVMEVSSHGLHQGRVNGVTFKGAVFTNLSWDHLDYHGSMEAYLKAKLLLFSKPELQFVVVNADDANSEQFLAVADKKVKRWAFSVSEKTMASAAENVVAESIEYSLDGISFCAKWGNEKAWVQTKIAGDFNLENILAVITVLLAQGCCLKNVVKKMSKLTPVMGRMECFGGGEKPYVFVDFAHTPDALEKVLSGLKKHCQQTLYLVFGCGGNRDKEKRAQMAVIAEKNADWVIITNDNPRFEQPEQIVNDIVKGFTGKQYEIIQDREQAIQKAVQKAAKKDCVVVVGKGHEKYQITNGVKKEFSDQKVVNQSLQEWIN